MRIPLKRTALGTNPAGERGAVLFFIIIMLTLIAVIGMASRLTVQSRRRTQDNLQKNQVRDIARGGILDALNWFRRQTVQPVASDLPVANRYPTPDDAFAPTTSTTTPDGGTIDASIGLVKEYELSPERNFWARHEVRRQGGGPSDPHAAHDITALRFANVPAGEGRAWSLVSRGLVFERRDANAAFDQSPNRIIQEAFAYSEIQRFRTAVPPNCGVLTPDAAASLFFRDFTTVDGNSAAPGVLTFSNPAVFNANGAVILGVPNPVVKQGAVSLTVQDFFGVPQSDLPAMSDLVLDDSILIQNQSQGFNSAAFDNTFVYIKGSASVPRFSISGSGIIFVDGSAEVTGSFAGLIFVLGDLRMYQVQIRGAVVVTGALRSSVMSNSHSTANNVIFDQNAVQLAIAGNSQYREVRQSFLLGADR